MGKYSDYKYVSFSTSGYYEDRHWVAALRLNHNGHTWSKWFKTEREAAIGVDMKLIELGKEPVNILKKKKVV